MAHDSFEEDYELANGHTGIGAVARQFHNQMMERKDAEIEKLKGQRDRAVEALRLMYKLHMKACDDAGGCPYDCLPGESCDSCTPSMAEKVARAAIAESEADQR